MYIKRLGPLLCVLLLAWHCGLPGAAPGLAERSWPPSGPARAGRLRAGGLGGPGETAPGMGSFPGRGISRDVGCSAIVLADNYNRATTANHKGTKPQRTLKKIRDGTLALRSLRAARSRAGVSRAIVAAGRACARGRLRAGGPVSLCCYLGGLVRLAGDCVQNHEAMWALNGAKPMVRAIFSRRRMVHIQ